MLKDMPFSIACAQSGATYFRSPSWELCLLQDTCIRSPFWEICLLQDTCITSPLWDLFAAGRLFQIYVMWDLFAEGHIFQISVMRTLFAAGHVDFYVNGGWSQPGCQVPVITLQKIASRGLSFNPVEGACLRYCQRETFVYLFVCITPDLIFGEFGSTLDSRMVYVSVEVSFSHPYRFFLFIIMSK